VSERRHRDIISKGVEEWNRWRRENPGERPDLANARIRIRELGGIDLSGADIRGALLTGADLSGADLSGADLSGADLMGADLSGADLSGADLRGANLMGADLRNADLTSAVLDDAVLYRADLEGSDCVCRCLWFESLMDFADGLRKAGCPDEGFEFEDMAGALVESSYVSTESRRLDIEISDPVSTCAVYEILGALNRLYSAAADGELPGPIIRIGIPD